MYKVGHYTQQIINKSERKIERLSYILWSFRIECAHKVMIVYMEYKVDLKMMTFLDAAETVATVIILLMMLINFFLLYTNI